MKRLDGFVTAAAKRIRSGYYHTQAKPLTSRQTFVSALQGPTPVIAELKPKTPSQGVLFSGDPASVLADFVAGGAAGLSVLTDPDFFDGSLDNLRLAHGTGLPVLFKDFVIDEVQIACAAHHGAAAILLIERILHPAQREALVAAAHAAGLEVVLEVHDEDEWETARHSAADIIGVNARDLDTLRLDRARQIDLIARISPERIVLSLSGVRRRADRVAAQHAGAKGVLVGTTLMHEGQRRHALMALRRPIVKVCGVRRVEDLEHAVAAGADIIGIVVLSPDSPRDTPLADAARLVARAHALGAEAALVTRASDADAIVAAVAKARPDILQWHGAYAGLRSRVRALGCDLFAATAPGETAPLDIDGIVLDSQAGGISGGTGQPHDWSLAGQEVLAHPHATSLIAGGLDASNVQEALAQSGAWGADASSRLEMAPGMKDPAKVSAFIAAARA